MAQLAHIQSQVIPASTRTRRVIGGAILALLVAGAVVLALTLPGSDSSSTTTPVNPPSAVAPDARFDGGPDEGTRGIPLPAPTADLRFDGGPQEGTRGRPAVAPGTRFDGGPERGKPPPTALTNSPRRTERAPNGALSAPQARRASCQRSLSVIWTSSRIRPSRNRRTWANAASCGRPVSRARPR